MGIRGIMRTGARLLAAAMLLSAATLMPADDSRSAQLTIGDGVVVKSQQNGEIVVRDTLSVRGSVLTSVKDDVAAGQTGQTPQAPQKGDWLGISFEASSGGADNKMELAAIRYAGRNTRAAISVRKTSPLLHGLEVTDNLNTGILVTGGSTSLLKELLVKNNAIGVEINGATPTVQSSFLSGNTQGIVNQTPGTPVTASGNWWGHPTGPGGVGSGQGDSVGTGTVYSPWATVIPLLAPSIQIAEAPVTDTPQVHLNLDCPTAVEMRVGEDSTLAGAAFEPFSTSRLFTLAGSDGNKTVYAQFRAATGNTSAIIGAQVRLDTQGPSITVSNLAPGAIVNRPLTVNASAADTSGVERIDLYVDGALAKSQTGGALSYFWNILSLSDGPHQVKLVAVDNVAHSSEALVNVSVVKAPPAAPVITYPPDGSAFNVDNLTVQGTAEPNTTVGLLVGGAAYKQTVATGTGTFQIAMTSVPDGIYQFSATASDAAGTSPRSASVTVSFDSGPPNEPKSLVATPGVGGVISLSWGLPDGEVPKKYNLYRSTSNFVSKNALDVVLAQGGLTAVKTTDKPLADGDYYYGVTALDAANNEGALSNIMSARSDRTLPTAALVFSPVGTTGPGTVNVTMNLSEAVQGTPFLSVTPQGQGPIVIGLAPSSSILWTGSFTVTSSHATGPAAVSFSARDIIGNVGTQITSGGALAIDNRGPRAAISFGGTVFGPGAVPLTVHLDEPSTITTVLNFTPPAGSDQAITLSGSGADWTGTLSISTGMGEGVGTFTYSATDAFGNVGTEITQGKQLTLDATAPPNPTGLAAVSNKGGVVDLTWSAGGAVDPPKFNVYRVPSAQTITLPATPVAAGVVANNLSNVPPADGDFKYAITALDPAGNESGLSNVATATSDRTAPGVPGATTATLNTPQQQIDVQWTAPAGEVPASYNLYRSTSQIVSVSGLTPAKTGLAGLSTADIPPGDGTYYYAATSLDSLGNESGPSGNSTPLAFDFAPPVISVAGVTDGGMYKGTVTPVISATDASLQSLTATLDGQPYTSGTPVSGEGAHTLAVQASDANGNSSGRNVTFTIDLTLPAVTVTGVSDGASYIGTVTPVASFFDVFMDVTGITLNGAPFTSGTPVTVDGSYALVATASDKAGNSRAVTVAFTVDGPPSIPPKLIITALQGSSPVLEWTASPSADVAGYHVYKNGIRLTGVPQSAHTFTDNAYNILASQTYGVTAVDTAGHESQPRNATLPAVQMSVTSYGTVDPNAVNSTFDPQTGLTTFSQTDDKNVLSKRYIEAINVDVLNQESQSLQLSAISMKLKDRFATVMDTLRNGPFTVGGGNTLKLENVMPVGDDADDARTVEVSLYSTKSSTAEVKHMFSRALRAKDPGRRVEIFTEPMIFGGMATVRLRIFNHGSVPVQVLTSLAGKESPDVTVNLKTIDGSLLATAKLEDHGPGVINYMNYSLAEIKPGASYLSGPVQFVVPASSPSEVIVEAVVSNFYYHYNQGDEVSGSPLVNSVGAKITNNPYYATSSPAAAVYDQGSSVVITGQALDSTTNAPVSNVPVKVGISVKGFDRFFFATTDSSGNYSLTFVPLPVEAGNYTVWAVHPNVFDRPVQSSFAILGLSLNPREAGVRMSKNFQLSFPLKLKNTGETTLNLSGATVLSTTTPKVQVTADTSGMAASLGPDAETTIQVTVHADIDAPDTAGAVLRVAGSGGIGITRDLAVNLALSEAKPIIQATPAYLETGLNRGAVKTLTVKIENKGLASLQNIQIAPPNASWMVVNRDLNAGSLAVGDTMEIGITLRPDMTLEQGQYSDRIIINSSNHIPYTVNILAMVTSAERGNVQFLIKDTLNELVPEAVIKIQNEKLTDLLYNGKTDAQGQFAMNDMPEGKYRFTVQAPGHEGYMGNFEIVPGVTTPVTLFLSTSFISLEWSVTPITIQDRYEIKLSSTFKTYVPEPWLEIDPPSVQLKMAPDSTFVGEFRVTNRGLIAVNNVTFTPKAPSGMTLEVLITEIPRIEAQQTIVIPYKVTIGTHHSPLSIDLCDPFGALVETRYDFPCAAGFTTNGYTQFGVQVAVSVYGHVTDPVASIAKDICDLVSGCNDCCGLINCIGIFNPAKGLLGTLSYIDGAYDCFKAIANCLGPLFPPAPPSSVSIGGGIGGWGGGGGIGGWGGGSIGVACP